jgi:hypothetical protein
MKMKINNRYSILKSTIAAISIVAILAVGATVAQAQLGGVFGSKPADGVVVDKDAYRKSTDDVIGKVLTARIAFLNAKAKLMEALGLKTYSVMKASEALCATEGSTSSKDKMKGIEESKKITAEADQQLADSLAQSKELSAESKVKFAEGSGKFIEGVLLERDQIERIQKLVEQGQSMAQSASLFEKPKVLGLVKPVTTLSTMVPGDVKEGTSTLGKIMKFAKRENISIPNADTATASLGSLD